MSKQTKYVLLFGATGFVGEKIIDQISKKGYTPIVITRNLQKPADYIQIQGNLDKPQTILNKVQKYKITGIIYLMGIIKENKKISFKKIHYEWLVVACKLAEKLGIQRFVYMSANGAKKEGTKYQNSKYLGEQYLIKSEFIYTIFRPSIIADHDTKNYNFIRVLENQLRFGFVPIIGNGRYSLSPVTRDDIAKIFTLALDEKRTFFKSFDIGGPTYTYKQLVTLFASTQNKKIITVGIPIWIIKIAITLFGWLPFFPITKDQLTMLLEGNEVKDQSIWKILQIQPQKIDTIMERGKT